MQLVEGLMHHNKEYLLEIARFYELQSRYKMKKAVLCEALAQKMCDNLLTGLVYLKPADYEVFVKLEGRGCAKLNPSDLSSYDALQDLGLIIVTEDNRIEVFPEINEAFNKQIKNAQQKKWLLERQAFKQKIREYILAAVNLYGMMPVADFLSLYAEYEGIVNYEGTETIKEMRSLFNEDLYLFSYIEDGWLMDDNFITVSEEEIAYFKKEVTYKGYYIPEKEEFLRYTETFYHEETKEVMRLKDFLYRRFPQGHVALEAMIDLLIDGIKIQITPQAHILNYFLEDLDQKGFQFHDINEINELANRVMLVNNTSRMWINRGCTPIEVRKAMEASEHKKKIGRNDPCPCGSGKKYKNCCGYRRS